MNLPTSNSSKWASTFFSGFCLYTQIAAFMPISSDNTIRCYCSVSKSYPTLCNSMDCNMRGYPVLHYLPEFAQTPIHWVGDIPSNHLILCHLLLLPPSIFPSIRAFSNKQALCIKWLKYWSFSFSISSSSEYSGLISLDWLSKGSQKSSLATQIWYAQCITTQMIVWVNMLHDRQAKTKHTHFLLWLWWSKWN